MSQQNESADEIAFAMQEALNKSRETKDTESIPSETIVTGIFKSLAKKIASLSEELEATDKQLEKEFDKVIDKFVDLVS